MSLDLELYAAWFLDCLFNLQVIESADHASIYMELRPDSDPESATMRQYHKAQHQGLRLLSPSQQLLLKNHWVNPSDVTRPFGLKSNSVTEILSHLARRGLICSPYLPYPFGFGLGGREPSSPLPDPPPGRHPYVLIAAPGALAVIEVRAGWQDAAPADTPLAERILRWMYDHGHREPSLDVRNFLVSRHATIQGRWQYRLDQVIDATQQLGDSELAAVDERLSSEDGLMAWLTAGGRRCMVFYGGDIPEYLRKEDRVGDTYNVGAAGAVGRGARADQVNIDQSSKTGLVDLIKLAMELADLRAELRRRATDLEHDQAIGEIAAAQLAAQQGDREVAMTHLGRAGRWVLEVATSIGTTVASAAIQAALGMR